jgi:biopolymer transport protein ExbD
MNLRRRPQPQIGMNFVPMIDVVFQLILFFLVSTTFAIMPGISLVLPQASTAEPVAMTKLVVTVKSAEEVYVNQERVTLDSLDSVLQKIADPDKKKISTVIFEADKDVPYGTTIRVLDVLRKNGFRGINLRTGSGRADR